jgi:hypothetical protein
MTFRAATGLTGKVRAGGGVGAGQVASTGGSTSLNSLFNGADTGTIFTDTSPNSRVLTSVGGAQTRTAVSLYGGSSGIFTGGGLTTPVLAGDDWSTSGGTIEFFLYLNATGTTGGVFDCTGGGGGFQLYVGTNYLTVTGANSIITNPGWAATTWYHVAFVKGAIETSVYGNGVRLGGPATLTFNATTAPNLSIGRRINGTLPVEGYLQAFRITPGQELYTGATYTIPTLPFSS